MPLGWFGGGRRSGACSRSAAHSDDLEIGCGATILALTRASPGSGGALGRPRGRRARAERGASERGGLPRGRGQSTVEILPLPRRLPAVQRRVDVKDAFEELKRVSSPSSSSRTRADDLHQDHRLACELTWNTFRDHLVLEYEIPKWDGDLGRPNLYVPLERGARRGEAPAARRHFGSAALEALVRRRGVPRADAAPGHGVPVAERVRGGVQGARSSPCG